jgi:hypothetical protein
MNIGDNKFGQQEEKKDQREEEATKIRYRKIPPV